MRRILVAMMLASVVGAVPAVAQVQVNNADLWLSATQPTGTFSVTNEGTEVLQFTLEDGDWDRTDDGTNRFLAPGSPPTSCERGLQAFPRQLRLSPGTTQTGRVSLAPAPPPPRACWSIIFVQTETGGGGQANASIRYVSRVGVKVYYVP